MRVLHVHRIAGIGGSERHLLALLPALARRGVEPFFLGLDTADGAGEPFYRELEAAGVPAFRLPAARDLDPALARRLVASFRGLRPHLVHTHLVHADVYGAAAAARLRLPLVSSKHNDDRFRLGPFRHVERAATLAARGVIAITHALARFCVERVGLPAEKVEVVHYGLDRLPVAWGPNPGVDLPREARVLLAISRLTEQKGLGTAVEALPGIRAEHPGAVLVVLGEGPLREPLRERAKALGVADALLLPGRAGDIVPWLERAEVFVHPARWEGFGLVLLEAMLARLPIVASRVSSIPEIVRDGETGDLVPPGDAGAFAAAVRRTLREPELGRRQGEAGLARARAHFSETRMAEHTLSVYERAMRARPARRPERGAGGGTSAGSVLAPPRRDRTAR